MISSVGRWWFSRTRWEQTALAVWAIVLLVVCTRAFVQPNNRTVYPIFSDSARLWWNTDELYEPHRPDNVWPGYRYSPTFAILFSPFAIVPDAIGGILWRVLSAAFFIGSLAWLARSVLPGGLSRDQFALLTLICLPLSVQSLNNGQANVVVIASMMATVASLREKHWNFATAMLTVAFICKVYPIAFAMLLIVLYPRQLLWRTSLAILASLIFPFMVQHWDYVLDQNKKWIELLLADDRTAADDRNKHRDLWLLIDIYHLPVSRFAYRIIQMAGGAGIAALLWVRQRQGWEEKSLLTSALGLGVCWILVLGPVVESSTFQLLAPSLAWSLLASLRESTWPPRRWLLTGSGLLFILAAGLGSFGNTADLHILGIHPMASSLYFSYLLTEPRPQQSAVSATPRELRAAA